MSSYEDNISYLPQKEYVGKFLQTGLLRCWVFFLSLSIYYLISTELITEALGLAAYSFLLVGYIYIEMRNLWKLEKKSFWISPVVLASIFTFILPFGVTNVLYFLSEDSLIRVGLEPIATQWMNQLLQLVLLGAIFMWVGYSSSFARSIGRMLQRSRVLGNLISPNFRVNKTVLYFCLALSLVARLYAVKLGVYGYSSSYDQVMAAANYKQFVSMAYSLGTIALICAAMQAFSGRRPTLVDNQILYLILGYEVVFGFLSGMKSSAVMPFIIVGFVYYSQRNRFPRWLLPVVVVGLFAAYSIIEPFRNARYSNRDFEGTSLSSIASTMTSASSENRARRGGEQSTNVIDILARINMTYIGSLGIEYSSTHSELPTGSPEFLGNLLLAPVHAIVPRFLWIDKPIQNIGHWYTQKIIGHQYSFTSTAMSAFTYLNFAGGPLAVLLGFMLVGILQRGLFDGLRHFGGGGIIIIFGLLDPLVNIDSAFNSLFVNLIRLFPILIAIQYVLLRGTRR